MSERGCVALESRITGRHVPEYTAVMRGMPTQVTEVRDVAEIIKALKGKGATVVMPAVDGTAVEITE